MKRTTRYLFLSFLFSAFCFGQEDLACYHFDKKGSTRPLLINQTHLKAHLSFDTVDQRVIGEVVIDFLLKRHHVDSIAIDAPNMTITALQLNGKKARYSQHDKQIVVATSHLKPTAAHQLTIAYKTQPQKGLYFVGWTQNPAVRRQIWTQGQGIDNRHWLPHVDAQNDKLTSELIIEFDEKYEVISNGELVSKKAAANNQLEWHYHLKNPHASYLIMLGIGKYDKKEYTAASGIPITNYYYPEREETYAYTFRHTKAIFDWLENELNVPYPWGSYKQLPVKDFLYGGMENTGATIFNDSYHSDALEMSGLGYFRVNVHEMAHQWFGNYITSYAGRDHWLHEGFATYYEFLAEAAILGEETATLERLNALKSVLASPPTKPVAHSEAGNLGHYQKGGLVLHLLRETIGSENYKKAITHYLNQFAEKNVVTQDLENAIHQATGYVLDTFFYQWIHQSTLPEIRFSCKSVQKDNQDYLEVITRQNTGDAAPFAFATELVYSVGKKQRTAKLQLANAVDTVYIPEKQANRLGWYTLDPNRILPVTFQSENSETHLVNMLTQSAQIGVQWQAIQELKNALKLPKEEELLALTKAKLLPEIKGMALAALVRNDTLPAFFNHFLENQLSVPMAEALLEARWQPETNHIGILEKMLALPSMNAKDAALWSLFRVNQEELTAYLEIAAPYANRPYGVFPVSYAFLQFLNGNRQYGPVLFNYLQPEHDLAQRRQAIEIFGLIKAPNPEIFDVVLQASQHFNARMRGPAKIFIQEAYKDPNRKDAVVAAINKLADDETSVLAYYQKLGIQPDESK